MKILLLGGSGFIGRNIRETSIHHIIAPTHTELNAYDFRAMDRIMERENPEIIIKATHGKTLEENLLIDKNLYRFSKDISKIFNLSSGAIYGLQKDICHVQEKEIGNTVPLDTYGLCKYESYMRSLYYPNIINLHLFGVYGKDELTSRFIPSAYAQIQKGLPVYIYGDRKMSWIWVKELVFILDFLVLDHPPVPQSLNVCAEDWQLSELASKLFSYCGVPENIIITRTQQKEYTGDTSLLHQIMPPKDKIYTIEDIALKDII